MENDDGEYFVYGLIDPSVLRETKDRLRSTFSVGKGRGGRPEEHQKAVQRELDTTGFLLSRDLSKAERIRRILGRGEDVEVVTLVRGLRDSTDAMLAEGLAITVLEGLLNRDGAVLGNESVAKDQGYVRTGLVDYVTGSRLWSSPSARSRDAPHGIPTSHGTTTTPGTVRRATGPSPTARSPRGSPTRRRCPTTC